MKRISKIRSHMEHRRREVDGPSHPREVSGEFPPHRFQTSRAQLSLYYALIHRLHAHAAHVRFATDFQSTYYYRYEF